MLRILRNLVSLYTLHYNMDCPMDHAFLSILDIELGKNVAKTFLDYYQLTS